MTGHPAQPAGDRPAPGQTAQPRFDVPRGNGSPANAPSGREEAWAAPGPGRPDTVGGGWHDDGTVWPGSTGTDWPQDAGTGWPQQAGTGWPPNAGTNWPRDAGADWPDDAWDSRPDERATGWRDNAAMQGQTGAQQTREQQHNAQQTGDHQTGAQRGNAQRSAAQRGNAHDRSGPGQNWASQANAPHEQADWQAGDQADQPRFMDGPLHAGDERWSMLSYLGVPFLGFLVPLGIYLVKRRNSRFVRRQAAQALNLAVTGLLYTFSLLILAGVLALDSLNVALVIAVPLAAVLWIATLVYVIRAAAAASRGDYYQIPGWICATMAR
jgi:uncharacterized Tic20 family protein